MLNLVVVDYYITQLKMEGANAKKILELTQMGFSDIMAAAAVKNVPSGGMQQLCNWIIQNSHRQQQLKNQLTGGVKSQNTQKVYQSISGLVNQQFSAILQSKGYSKNVSQKSLLYTNNGGVEKAIQWIQQNKNQPGFQDQQKMQVQQQPKQSKLTDQQAKIKARQLQIRLRQERKKKQQADALQRQRNRIKGGKQLVAAKKQFQQAQKRRAAQLQKIQRKKDQQYRQRLVQQLQRQKAARLGKTYQAKKKQQQKLKQANPYQLFQNGCQQIRIAAPFHLYPGKAKVAYDTISIYLNNIITKQDQKFRKVNTQNNAFKTRIDQNFGARFTLQAAGFQLQGDFLVMKKINKQFIKQCVQLLGKYSAQAAKYQ